MANYSVTTTSDVVDANDGQLSLREAITAANANADADVITFSTGLLPWSSRIHLTSRPSTAK